MSTDTDTDAVDWEDKKLAAGQPSTAEQITEGDIYGDERHSEQADTGELTYPRRYEVVYTDENRVLLRNTDQSDDYRHERIPGFLEGVTTRWTRLSEGDGELESVPDFAAAIRLLKLKREEYAGKDSRKGSHVAEGITVAIDLLREMEPSPVEWTSVTGVGPKTADELEAAGIVTDIDAALASDDKLLDIPGVGEGTVENIRSEVTTGF